MSFNPQSFKNNFPLFGQVENQSLVYVDNAATTQKPHCVIEAISQFYLHQNGNAQRASHRLARAATAVIEDARVLAAEFLGLHKADADQIILTQGATASLNMIAYGLAGTLAESDEILLTHSEHHANLLPWQRLAKNTGAMLNYFPQGGQYHTDPQFAQWPSLVNTRTKIIALSAASNVTGQATDLSFIAQIKQYFPDIVVIVDASQIAAHHAIDVNVWQCDFLVCSAHKFYGPTGIGLLFARRQYLQIMTPLLLGGEMVDQVAASDSTFIQGPQRFEAGSSPSAAIAGLKACLLFWRQQNRLAMNRYEQELTRYLHQQLAAMCDSTQCFQLITQPDNNVGIATFIKDSHYDQRQFSLSDLAYYLDEHNIAVRVGHHCAQLLWQSLEQACGENQGLRVSIAAYNTCVDIDRLVAATKQFVLLNEESLEDKKNAIMDDLSGLQWQDLVAITSWQQRYKTLLRWSTRVAAKPHIRQPSYLVKGCESSLWLRHSVEGGRHYFSVDGDSNIIKGLSVLLLLWFNGKTTDAILRIDLSARYEALGLQKHLSPSRINGFVALVEATKQYLE